MPDYATDVTVPPIHTVEVAAPTIYTVEVAAGVRGPAGPAGDEIAFEYPQTVAAAEWVISHTFGRRPNVTVYVADTEVETRVTATTTTVTVSFPTPTAGTAVLT